MKRILSEETKNKIRQTLLGKKFTEEHKLNLSLSQKRKPKFNFKENDKSDELRKQRARHINHGFGNPRVMKYPCQFCEERYKHD